MTDTDQNPPDETPDSADAAPSDPESEKTPFEAPSMDDFQGNDPGDPEKTVRL
jgi:hypothetical protein